MKPSHDIFLAAWLKSLGKRQADLVRDLGWNKAKPSLIISGKQQYTRDDVNELAAYLSLHPYELLMHPEDAMEIRRLREDALKIVARNPNFKLVEIAKSASKPKYGANG